MLQGVSRTARKRHNKAAPDFLQGVNNTARKRHPCDTLKGATLRTQKCHLRIAPTSFIWCQLRIAAMPFEQRTKGRVTECPQQCYSSRALPTQFNGVIVKTQKCLDIVAPRGELSNLRRDAHMAALSPTEFGPV